MNTESPFSKECYCLFSDIVSSDYDKLAAGLNVVQFSLYSYSLLTNPTPASQLSHFVITGTVYDFRANWTPLSPITINTVVI